MKNSIITLGDKGIYFTNQRSNFSLPALDLKNKVKDTTGAGDAFSGALASGLEKKMDIKEILEQIKKNSTTKFDESIDVSLRINLKQSKGGDLSLRTVVNLPNGSGKKSKVAVLCEPDKIEEAKKAGADIVGSDDFIEKIKNGEINFEKLICTPSMMIKLSKLGKVLGPKGLMPNAKLGSVTEDLKKAITDAKSGQAEIRNDKDGNIGVSIGKKSFADDKLIQNYNAIIETLEKEKSNNTVKGELVKSAFVTSTMGVSYKLKIGKSI